MENERLSQPETEKKEHKGLKAMSYTAAAILIVFGLILLVNFIQGLQLKKAYNEAKEECFLGNYSQAIEGFEALGELNYQDSGAFISYCRARNCFEQGRIYDAETDMIFASFKYLSAEEGAEISAFEAVLAAALAEAPEEKPGEYRMEFYPDAQEFFYYHGQDFKDFEECEKYYFVNQASK